MTDHWGVPPYAEATRKAPAQRSFALPAPGLLAGPRPKNVIPEKFSLGLQRLSEQKCGAYFLSYNVNGVHSVFEAERLIIGGATICQATRKAPGSDGASPYLSRRGKASV